MVDLQDRTQMMKSIEKANRIKYRDNTFVIPQLIKLLSNSDYGRIDLFPEYQRRLVWRIDQQSALVESILLGVPIPSVLCLRMRLTTTK